MGKKKKKKKNKKAKPMKKKVTTLSDDHDFHFNVKSSPLDLSGPAANDTFAGLAKELEKRLGKIENDLKESMEILEADVNKIVRKSDDPQALEGDIANLSKTLETRIKATLDTLIAKSKSRADKDELKLVRETSSQLVKILSVDFFKSVLSRFNKPDDQTEVDEFGMDAHIVARIKPLFDFLYYKYWRVETTGIGNIPNFGRGLVVANHSGTLPYDGSMIAAAIINEHPVRKDPRFLVEDFVYHMPMLGSFMYRIGGVRACPENAERLLTKEHLVVVFPEGVKGIGKFYTERYKLQRFGRGGFIKLCINTQSPLIPVGIVGAEEIHPIIYKSNVLAKTIGVPYIPITPTFPLLGPLGLIPMPTKWRIHFGTPITFDVYDKASLENEIMIHKLSEKVRNEIQKILIELLKQRKSIWV